MFSPSDVLSLHPEEVELEQIKKQGSLKACLVSSAVFPLQLLFLNRCLKLALRLHSVAGISKIQNTFVCNIIPDFLGEHL